MNSVIESLPLVSRSNNDVARKALKFVEIIYCCTKMFFLEGGPCMKKKNNIESQEYRATNTLFVVCCDCVFLEIIIIDNNIVELIDIQTTEGNHNPPTRS